jgi:hypothetical protein
MFWANAMLTNTSLIIARGAAHKINIHESLAIVPYHFIPKYSINPGAEDLPVSPITNIHFLPVSHYKYDTQLHAYVCQELAPHPGGR